MTWNDAIRSYLTYLAARGCSDGTRKLRRYYLTRLAAEHLDFDWRAMPYTVLVAWQANPTWSPETRKSARAAARGFFGWAHDTGLISRNPAADLPAVTVPPGTPRPAPDQALERALLAAPGDREQLMLLMAAHAGMRRAEIAHAHTSWIIADTIHVAGKGGRSRIVPLTGQLADALKRRERANGPGYYFPGRIDGHLSPGHVGKILTELLGRDWSGHTLRHRFATRAYSKDRDLLAVQQLLGHSKPETTARYTAAPSDALRSAVDAVA